jgi:hypothetical protein
LEHDEVGGVFGKEVFADEGGWDAGGLAGAGGGDQDEVGVGAERLQEIGEDGIDGEREHAGDLIRSDGNDEWRMINDESMGKGFND